MLPRMGEKDDSTAAFSAALSALQEKHREVNEEQRKLAIKNAALERQRALAEEDGAFWRAEAGRLSELVAAKEATIERCVSVLVLQGRCYG